LLGSKSRHAGFSKADRAESTAEATSSCVAEGTRAIGRLVAGSKTLDDALEAEGTEAPPMKRPYSCSTTCALGRSIEGVDNKRVVNGLSQPLAPRAAPETYWPCRGPREQAFQALSGGQSAQGCSPAPSWSPQGSSGRLRSSLEVHERACDCGWCMYVRSNGGRQLPRDHDRRLCARPRNRAWPRLTQMGTKPPLVSGPDSGASRSLRFLTATGVTFL